MKRASEPIGIRRSEGAFLRLIKFTNLKAHLLFREPRARPSSLRAFQRFFILESLDKFRVLPSAAAKELRAGERRL